MFVNDNHFDGYMKNLHGVVKKMGKDLKSLILFHNFHFISVKDSLTYSPATFRI
jgi:hypothetical protein